jgi:hypothetical protein
MAISSAVCSSFKKELFQGYHDFDANGSGGDTFKIALYTSSATLNATTTDYSSTNEVAGGGSNTEVASGNGYTTAGNTLVNTGVGLTSTTAFTDFSDTSWTSASFTANGCLIYNTQANGGSGTTEAVCAIAFGGDKTVSSGTFTIQFPTNDSSSAILRLTA